MKVNLLLFTLLLTSNNAYSNDTLNILLLSRHIEGDNCTILIKDKPCEFNEKNYGINHSIELSRYSNYYFNYGVYYNSFYRLSKIVGFGYKSKYIGLHIAAVTGYPTAPILPNITPYFIIPLAKRTDLHFLTPFNYGQIQVVALQISFKLE